MSEEPGDEEARKSRLWTVDPDMFKPGSRRDGLGARSFGRVKSIGSFLGVSILFLYPVFLIYMGLVYGWIGFWGSFLGSATLIGLVLWRTGYSGNFQNAGNGSLVRSLVLLTVGFIGVALLYESLFRLGTIWTVLLFLIVLSILLGYKLVRG